MQTVKNWLNYQIKFNRLLIDRINKIESFFNNKNFEEEKNEYFLDFLHKTYQNNQFYRNFYKSFDVNLDKIKDYTDVYKLPVLTKELIKNNSNIIKTNRKLFFKGYTSGTSGNPLIIYRTLNAIINENAYVWWYRKQSGLNYRDNKVSIRGDLGNKRITYFDRFSNTLHISSFSLNIKNIHMIINTIETFVPKAIIGYPSSINTLASLISAQGKQIEIPLAFTSSETLYGFQQENIQKVFNTKIFDWYGNSERTIALYKNDNLYYEPPMYAINHYSKDNVLTTSLINKDFPLINYKVDDLIETNNKYDKSKLSIVIDTIEGRKHSFIMLHDESKVGTAALSLMFKDLDIICSQIIFIRRGVFNINIIPGKSFKNNSLAKLKKMVIKKLGFKNEITFNIISENEIIYSKSGKFIFIVKSKKNYCLT